MNDDFPVVPAFSKNSLIEFVDGLLNNPLTWRAVLPSFVNGGKCGHKIMDVKEAVDAIREADTTNKLKTFKDKKGNPINDFMLGNVLKNAMRRRLVLNPKTWKATDVNAKIAAANPELAKMFRDFLTALEHKADTSENNE